MAGTLGNIRNALLALGFLAAGLMAGFFYAYSVSVMPGLAAANDPASAIRAMQGINAAIRTPVFAASFFGALGLPLLASLLALVSRPRCIALLALGGTLSYALGCLTVTFAVSIPLNEALAAIPPAIADPAAVWRDYAGPWTAWNHLRTLAATLSSVLLAAALLSALRDPSR